MLSGESMDTPTTWGRRALLVACAATSGCAGPLTTDAFYGRLERLGIPSPVEPSAPAIGTDRADAPLETRLPDDGVTLADLFRVADLRNPDIRAARAAAGSAAGRAWQAGRYPNPSAGVTAGEIGFEGDSSNTVLSITQPIVLGGRLDAGVAGAEALRAARFADVDRVRRTVRGEVERVHARMLSVRAEIELLDELLRIAEGTLAIAETRFEARAVAEPDVIRPRVEVYQLRGDRRRLSRRIQSLETRLGLLLDGGPVPASSIGERLSIHPPEIAGDPLRAAIESGHPELLVADRETEAARHELERARSSRTPDLDVTLGVGYSEEGDQGIAELGVGAEVPLWDRGRGEVAAARFTLMRRRLERQATLNRLVSELAEARSEYDEAREQLGVISDRVIPEAQRAFDQINEAYRAGRASFLDLLDAQRTLMQSRRVQIQLAGDAAIARARLVAICGPEPLNDPAQSRDHSLPSTPSAPTGAEDTP